MRSYVVSIVWSKTEVNNQISIQNSVNILNANNKNEAFGIAYDLCIEDYKEYKMVTKLVLEIIKES